MPVLPLPELPASQRWQAQDCHHHMKHSAWPAAGTCAAVECLQLVGQQGAGELQEGKQRCAACMTGRPEQSTQAGQLRPALSVGCTGRPATCSCRAELNCSLELKQLKLELAGHAVHVHLARCTIPPELLVLALPCPLPRSQVVSLVSLPPELEPLWPFLAGAYCVRYHHRMTTHMPAAHESVPLGLSCPSPPAACMAKEAWLQDLWLCSPAPPHR